jgi:hypothetical protein
MLIPQFIEYRAAPKPRRPVKFMDMPLEIREMIWAFSLHEARVFHIQHFLHLHRHRNGGDPDANKDTKQNQRDFHTRYRPLPATQVCAESRRVAWRAGCFLLRRSPDHVGVWFNPKSDILYFDRNHRGTPGSGYGVVVPGMERVEHVGLEWRWLLQDGSRPLEDYSSEDMQAYWAAKTDMLYAKMPALRTIHYVLPMIRHQGGLPWGREPASLRDLPIELVDLPEETVVPIESGHKSWGRVREELVKTLSSEWQCRHKEEEFGNRLARFPPNVVGDRLIRVGAPTTFAHSTIRVFDW